MNVYVFDKSNFRYATEVDVDFVRKSVRAIGRCAIKVEQAAERCVSTLLDLIQTKVNYVVQEAIVVIKVLRIFFSLPNSYRGNYRIEAFLYNISSLASSLSFFLYPVFFPFSYGI